MSGLFKVLEGENAVLVQGGVYKVCDVYTRNDGELFAAFGGGYIRLKSNGTTSKDKVYLNTLTFGGLYADRFGNMSVTGGGDRKLLPEEAAQKYLPGIDAC